MSAHVRGVAHLSDPGAVPRGHHGPLQRPRIGHPLLGVAGAGLVALGIAGALWQVAPPHQVSSFYPATIGTLPQVYGPAVGADALQNTIVGGPTGRDVAYRFMATETSELESITVYIQTGEGYSGGDLGRLSIELVENDAAHGDIPSSRVLASTEVDPEFGAGNVYRFDSPARLEAGSPYHVVFRNIDDDAHEDFVSLNGLFVFGHAPSSQPGFPVESWAQLTRERGRDWTAHRGPGQGSVTPIMSLNYVNGGSAGVGYMEVWAHAVKEISGVRRARQTFTVPGPDRAVTAVSIRLKRVAGSGPLEYTLRERGGPVLASGSIPAEAFAISAPEQLGGATWATAAIDGAPTLASGRTYSVTFETDADTSYGVTVIREGRTYHYGPGTHFADGVAQYDGGDGWGLFTGWGEESPEADLQLYFDVVPPTG